MSSGYVLDSSAILCFLKHEPGWRKVEACLDGAKILSVNLSEVVAKLSEDGHAADAIRDTVADLLIPVIAFDADLALAAGLLRGPTRHLGLSLGDRACLALAMRDDTVALTADRAWSGVEGARVELVRP